MELIFDTQGWITGARGTPEELADYTRRMQEPAPAVAAPVTQPAMPFPNPYPYPWIKQTQPAIITCGASAWSDQRMLWNGPTASCGGDQILTISIPAS